jgi:hypothetical protein
MQESSSIINCRLWFKIIRKSSSIKSFSSRLFKKQVNNINNICRLSDSDLSKLTSFEDIQQIMLAGNNITKLLSIQCLSKL